MEELLLDMKGGNGTRKQKNAKDELARRNQLQAEKDYHALCEKKLRRQEQEEKQEWVRITLQEMRENMLAQAEEDRLDEERLEMERANAETKRLGMQAEEALRELLRQPNTCSTCSGSGKCLSCEGTGCISVTYLSPVVDGTSRAFRGKTFSGCVDCGGRQDGGELLELKVMKGNGHCLTCRGHGKTRRSEQAVEQAMQKSAEEAVEQAMQNSAEEAF